MKKKLNKEKIEIDNQLREFENLDLGEAIKNSGGGTLIVPNPRVKTSIVLDRNLIDQLKVCAKKKGLKYQTFLRLILIENIKRY